MRLEDSPDKVLDRKLLDKFFGQDRDILRHADAGRTSFFNGSGMLMNYAFKHKLLIMPPGYQGNAGWKVWHEDGTNFHHCDPARAIVIVLLRAKLRS